MEIVFQDKQKLSLIETDKAANTKLPIAVINSCRKKFNLLRAASDEQTLRGWKSFHYEKLKGDRSGQKSIKINDQWRLIFTVDTDCNPPKIVLLEIADYH